MAHTYANLLTHAIFSTKDRFGFIAADLGQLLFPYLGGIIRELNGTALAINGPTDHVHLLLALPPNLALSEAMRVLKTNSSRWVHEQWPQRRAFAWQTGYGAFSVSQSNADQVCAYIAGQEEHHRLVSFQEEFLAFLKRHGIAYDERYIWE
jgi:putative transposase